MITKRRELIFSIGFISAAMMFPWSLDRANAADFVQVTREAKLYPKAPVSIEPGSPIRADINVKDKFSSVADVCLRFIFENDLLDPGEGLNFSLKGTPIGSGAGIDNGGQDSQSDRVICYNPIDIPSDFLKGKATLIISMNSGSVTIKSLSVQITGYSK